MASSIDTGSPLITWNLSQVFNGYYLSNKQLLVMIGNLKSNEIPAANQSTTSLKTNAVSWVVHLCSISDFRRLQCKHALMCWFQGPSLRSAIVNGVLPCSSYCACCLLLACYWHGGSSCEEYD